MSPARGQKKFVPTRPRAEVYTAVAVSVAIVLGTVLMIWLLRPGTPGVKGEGGLLSRQPRVTMLVLLAAAAIVGVVVFVLRRRRPPKIGARGAIAIGVALVVIVAFVGGVFWPGGVVRHWPKRPKTVQTPVTNPVSVPSSTTAKTAPGTTAKTGTSVSRPTTPTTPTTPTSPTTKGR